jgi:transposase
MNLLGVCGMGEPMKQERTEQQELPERWSAKRKAEVVMRLVRGEDLGEVSREVQVAPPELEEWRRAFLQGAEVGLKKRAGDPLENELVRTRAKLGETMMRLELAEMLLEKRGYVDDVKKLRRSGTS